jgi:hypothetical protein
MIRRSVPLFFALMVAAASAWAVNYTNDVLEIGVGARALGMGGSYVALADDSTATYWNPAGLTSIKHMEVAIVQQGTENAPAALGTNDVGSQYFFMSGGMTLPKIGSLGVAVMRFGVDGIPQIPATVNGQVPCSTCPPPNQIGTFGTQDVAVLLSYAKTVHPAVDLGLTAKILTGGTSGLVADATTGITGNYSYNYFGLDLGVIVKFGVLTSALEGLNLGVNLQDLANSGVKWNTSTSPDESVPMNAKSGLAYSLPFDFLKDNHSKFTLTTDIDPKYSTLVHYGAEIWYKDTLAFRAGMRQFTSGQQANEASFGASFRLFSIIQVDYAYIDYELTPIQYISMLVRF